MKVEFEDIMRDALERAFYELGSSAMTCGHAHIVADSQDGLKRNSES